MNRIHRSICLLPLLVVVVLGQTPEPRIKPLYDQYFVPVPTQLQLECSIQGGYQDVMEWKKDNQALSPSFTVATFNGTTTFNNITISNTRLEDSGNYQCRVKDTGAEVTQVVRFFRVDIANATYVTKDEESLKLKCVPEFSGPAPEFTMTWQRNNTNVEPSKRHFISSANYSLEIKDPKFDDIGEYQCVFNFTSNPHNQVWVVKANVFGHPKIKKFPLSKNLIQGEKLDLICDAMGHPMPQVQWMKEEDVLEASDRISFRSFNTIKNAQLTIDEVEFTDRGDYICVAQSTLDNSTTNSTVYIRVKDKLAALWPFLGIVAEVFILCIIIFIYEKRRAKNDEEEDDMAAGAGSATVDHKGNDDVRQRNVRT